MSNDKNPITRSEREHMFLCMKATLETIQEAKCRCEAINKKMRKSAIQAISQIREISFYKAKKIYENYVLKEDEFHTCCSICCDCHYDGFRSDQGFY
jgi:hypothetical protein